MARKNNKKLRKTAITAQSKREAELAERREKRRKTKAERTKAEERMSMELAEAGPSKLMEKRMKKKTRRNKLHAEWAARKGIEATFPIKKDKKLKVLNTEVTMEKAE